MPTPVLGCALEELEQQAKEMGREYVVLNRGYPDPFLLLDLDPVRITHESNDYEFSGFVVAIHFSFNKAVAWHVFQEDGHIMHPHLGGSLTPLERSFCFGGNLNTLESRFKDSTLKVFVGMLQAYAAGYARNGAYRNIAEMAPTHSCRCVDPNHHTICEHCAFTAADDRKRHHWSELTCSEDGVWVLSAPTGSVNCQSCGARIQPFNVVQTEDGQSACSICTTHTPYGVFRTTNLVNAWTIRSQSGTRQLVPRALAAECEVCNRTVERGAALCSRARCPERGASGD